MRIGKWVRVVAAFGFVLVPSVSQLGLLADKQTISLYSTVHANTECFRHDMNEACPMRHADGRNMPRRVNIGPMRQHYQCLTLRVRRKGAGRSGIGNTKNVVIATGVDSTAVAAHGSTHGKADHGPTRTLSSSGACSMATEMFLLMVLCIAQTAAPFQDRHTCSLERHSSGEFMKIGDQ